MFIDKIKTAFGVLLAKVRLKLFTQEIDRLNISIFQNLKQVNILVWNEIIETQNTKLLDVNYAETTKYTKQQLKALNNKFTELYDAYFLALNNPHAKRELKETQKKVYLSAKILILHDCVNSLFSIKRNYNIIKNPLEKEKEIYECIKVISKNIVFPSFNSIDENIEIISKLIVSNETTFKREYGETKEEQDKKSYSFEKQLVDVGQVLPSGIPDATKISVLMWVELINKATEISKQRAENGRNKE